MIFEKMYIFHDRYLFHKTVFISSASNPTIIH